ncbi:MAG: hypothetical protein M1827_006108 [Pycnora praestabilis]|nr:MAG: hypothetical protein M1827_006108 [Pycnora praestabilis]
MKFFGIAAFGGLAVLTSAAPDHWQANSVLCTDGGVATVTQTVTVTAGGAPPMITGASSSKATPASTYMTTSNGIVTSVVYNTLTTSTYCPAAGVYSNPYQLGKSITCGAPSWTTVVVPYSTVYAYPSAGTSKDATVVVYQDVTVVSIQIITINIQVVSGSTMTATTTKTDSATSTPPPPPPFSSPSSTFIASGSAQTHVVQLGAFGTPPLVQYLPNNITANVGDVVEFQILAKAHSATQSNFATPCIFNGGFDTGLIANANSSLDAQFSRTFTVNTTSPLWFYCKNPGPPSHCSLGMVFGINPPPGKMQQFIDMAKTFGNATVTSTSTSTTSTSTSKSTSTSSSTSSSTTHVVQLGAFGNPPLVQYVPNNITAHIGDIVEFQIGAKAHSATQSNFATPCIFNGGFDTGLIKNEANSTSAEFTRSFEVNTTSPLWFYCKNPGPPSHCSLGMVFGINPPPGKMQQFIDMAKASGNATVTATTAMTSWTTKPMIRGRSFTA